MITVDDMGAVAVVRLEHGKVNALDLELLRAITATFAHLDDADAVVFTGAGRAFSAGVDLQRIVDGGPAYVAEFLPALSEACLAVFNLRRPVVAAVNGHAIAGGCVLACACDRRFMSGGTIGLTEMLVGVPFPTVPLEVSRHVLGPATDGMVLTGRTVGPEEAKALGLVDVVTDADALLETAVAEATTLARIPRATYAMTKIQLHRATLERIAARQPHDDTEVTERWQSVETIAGMADFLASLARR